MAGENQPNHSLGELRREIDAIDAQLVALINARGRAAAAIGAIKNTSDAPIYAPDREQEILARVCKLNAGPFPDRVILAVYRELMSGSFSLERPQRIAYLGPPGSFSHLAATGKFGASVEYTPVAEIRAVFREVERGHADFAVVPVENSTGGGVIDTLDALINSPVRVCAEVHRRIHHNLLSRAPLSDIERLYSKPEVFSQCRNWLLETGLLEKTIPVASTSRAAELAATEPGAAALGSTLAAELHCLPLQVANVEDDANNVTRFFVLGKTPGRPTGDDKTVIMFTTSHQAGALVDVLEAFRSAHINLTMITSRPNRRRNWEYYFFVDAEGHADDENMSRALQTARQSCLQLSVLGSFPRASEPL